MKKILFIFAFVLLAVSCNSEKPAAFPEEVLNQKLVTLDKSEITFQELLDKHKGKKVFVEIVASWCKECVSGLPDINKLKENHPDAVFVSLSIDKTEEQWKNGVDRFKVDREHYFIKDGLKSDYAVKQGIKDIPNFMVVNELGIVSLSHVIEPTDPRLEEVLND